MEYPLILISLVFTTAGQFLQKLGANKAAASQSRQNFIIRSLCQQEIWWAIGCLIIGTLLWLAVLYRMEVSKAFPFLSLGFVLVMLGSRYFLREIISPTRWFGISLICIGIILVSST